MKSHEYEHFRGDTFIADVEVFNSDGTTRSIVGSTVMMTIKENVGDADDAAVFKIDVTAHTNASLCHTQIVIPAAGTDSLPI